MPERAWGSSDVPDLTGKTAVVTGANSGVGLETAVGLAAHGARVVMACRDEVRAKAAAFHIRSVVDGPALEVLILDLASLESVRRAAKEYSESHDGLDILVNNAAVMGPPRLSSADGYELQFATNHLGHYALTGLLLPPLLRTPGARVITVTSPMHRMGRLNGIDPAHPEPYRRWTAYGTSKLANLLFTHELERRLEQARADALAAAAHPGWTRTNLVASGPLTGRPRYVQRMGRLAGRWLGHSATSGAQPILRAATAPDVRGGECYGPGGLLQLVGPASRVGSSPASHRRDLAARLWQESDRLTGVHYGLDGGSTGSAQLA